jgi:hypothetical protein
MLLSLSACQNSTPEVEGLGRVLKPISLDSVDGDRLFVASTESIIRIKGRVGDLRTNAIAVRVERQDQTWKLLKTIKRGEPEFEDESFNTSIPRAELPFESARVAVSSVNDNGESGVQYFIVTVDDEGIRPDIVGIPLVLSNSTQFILKTTGARVDRLKYTIVSGLDSCPTLETGSYIERLNSANEFLVDISSHLTLPSVDLLAGNEIFNLCALGGDQWGNYVPFEKMKEFKLEIDRRAPKFTEESTFFSIKKPSDSSFIHAGFPRFEINVNQVDIKIGSVDESKVSWRLSVYNNCSLDNSSFNSITIDEASQIKKINVLGQGDNNFYIHLRDEAGNCRAIGANVLDPVNIFVDSLAPNVSLTSPSANSFVITKTKNEFDVAGGCEAGSNSLKLYTVVNEAYILLKEDIGCDAQGRFVSAITNASSIGEGEFKIVVKQSDPLGNTGVSQELVVSKDTIEPTIDVTSPSLGAVVARSFNLQGSVSANSSINSLQISQGAASINMQSVPTLSGNFSTTINLGDFTEVGDGSFNIILTAIDTAGNVNSLTRSYVKDTIAPSFGTGVIEFPKAQNNSSYQLEYVRTFDLERTPEFRFPAVSESGAIEYRYQFKKISDPYLDTSNGAQSLGNLNVGNPASMISIEPLSNIVLYQYGVFADENEMQYEIVVYAKDMAGNVSAPLKSIPIRFMNCPDGFIKISGDGTLTSGSYCVGKYEMRTDGSSLFANDPTKPVKLAFKNDSLISGPRNLCAQIGGSYSDVFLIKNSEWRQLGKYIENDSRNWVDSSYPTAKRLVRGKTIGRISNMLSAGTNENPDGAADTIRKMYIGTNNSDTFWDLAGNYEEWVDDSISDTTSSTSSYYFDSGNIPTKFNHLKAFNNYSVQGIDGAFDYHYNLGKIFSSTWNSSTTYSQARGGDGIDNSSGLYTTRFLDGTLNQRAFRCVIRPFDNSVGP